MPEEIPLLDFAEARDYFRSLIPMTDEEWALIEEEIRARVFTVANVTSMRAVLEIYEQLERRLSEGVAFEEFQSGVLNNFADMGFTGPEPWQLENIFDTNIQTAYGYGRFVQHSDMADFYPYGEYVDVGDDRVRPWHRDLRGQIHLMTSEFWRIHYPPWEFR